MSSVDVHVRYSPHNVTLDKVTTLSIEGNLIYNDGDVRFRTLAATITKFAVITAASPLIALARITRSVAFASTGNFDRAKREFIGGLTVPFVAGACLAGSLISSGAYLIDRKNMKLHVQMRRTYAHFEAWINGIALHNPDLQSFSVRASSPLNFIGEEKSGRQRVWTTAPCMQPILERGYLRNGGLLDGDRMKKIFPLIPFSAVRMEADKVVLLSQYEDKHRHVIVCNGACEHARSAVTCCCFRIETAYDRVLCCQVGQGNCSSILNHGDTCGFVFCSAGCVGICCCTEKNNLASVATCLI